MVYRYSPLCVQVAGYVASCHDSTLCNLPSPPLLPFSPIFQHTDARSLIQWLLSFHPQERPNLDQILKHPWLKATGKATQHTPTNKTIKPHITTPSSNAPRATSSAVSKGHQTNSSPHKTAATPCTSPSSIKSSVPPNSPNKLQDSISISGSYHTIESGGSVSASKGRVLPAASPNGKYVRDSSLPRSAKGKHIQGGSNAGSTQTSKSNRFVRRLVPSATQATSSVTMGDERVGMGGNRGQQGLPDPSRTPLQAGRKHAF